MIPAWADEKPQCSLRISKHFSESLHFVSTVIGLLETTPSEGYLIPEDPGDSPWTISDWKSSLARLARRRNDKLGCFAW